MPEAEANTQSKFMENESEQQRLKYLEFVQVAALYAAIYAVKLYNYAKDNSGPLKPGVCSVEDTINNVVSPVYQKYHDVPIEILKFVDRKVDESVNKVQSHVPTNLKEVSTKAFEKAQKAPAAARTVMTEIKNAGVVETASGLAKSVYAKYEPAVKNAYSKYEPSQKAPEAVRTVVTEIKNTGVVETASGLAKTVYAKYEPAVKNVYSKYEPVAEQYVASAWCSLNKLPLFPRVAQAVTPTANYCSEKYNQTVQISAEKGYRVASYLPLVPTEKIAKMLNTANMETRLQLPVEVPLHLIDYRF